MTNITPTYPVPSFAKSTSIAFDTGKAVKLAADRTVALCTAGDKGIGFTNGASDAGENGDIVAVRVAGIMQAKLGGTVTYGVNLAADANGDLVVAVATDYVLATALEWGVDDDYIAIQIIDPYILAA